MALPKQIARFDVIGWLGSGSFATVWLANDRNLDSRVAIKVLAENWSFNADATRRFIQEARDLRRLDDERIIRVYEAGELEDGRPYMVMDYADGGSLHQRMAKRVAAGEAFSVEEAVDISQEIADCLISAHSHRIVHRDLKPSNVLFKSIGIEKVEALRRDGRPAKSERLVLGDFGIARRLEGTMTYTQVVGTPHYMAPEQADPETAKDADYRCDIYAAAVILYELLAGRVPYPYESLSRVQKAQREEDPTPIRELRPAVSPELGAVVARGLSRDVENRIASAVEWRRELAAAVTHAGSEAPHPAAEVQPATPATPAPPPAAPAVVASPTIDAPAAPIFSQPNAAMPPAPLQGQVLGTPAAGMTPPMPSDAVVTHPKRVPARFGRRNLGMVAAAFAVVVALAGTVLFIGQQRVPAAGNYVFATAHDGSFAVDRAWTLSTDGRTLTGVATVSNSALLPADYQLVEVIPKSLAPSVLAILFLDQPPTVLRDDPVVRFTFHVAARGKSSARYVITVPARGASHNRLAAWAHDQAIESHDWASQTPLPLPLPTSTPSPSSPKPTPTHKASPQPPATHAPVPTPTHRPTPGNRPPTAYGEWWTFGATVACDKAWPLSVLNPGGGVAPDSDPDHDPLTIVTVTEPSGHSTAGVTTTIVAPARQQILFYFPCAARGTGTWTFIYTISDGHGHTASALDHVIL